MKPIEFEKKYKCYAYGVHPIFKGKEIKQDIQNLLAEDNGFSYRDKDGLLHVENGDSYFTKNSIRDFEEKFIKGKYPLSNNQEYYLEFVGAHEDILIAKKKTL